MEIKFMNEAVELSRLSIEKGGGPFGAVVVKDGKVVGRGHNRVTLNNDPTAHAEVNAIREACKELETFELKGCEIYTSCEPCPMCLSAIYWSRLDNIYYANSQRDAKEIDFDDAFIYEELDKSIDKRSIPMKRVETQKALEVFQSWKGMRGKVEY
jgi:guanine deaminase